jgi:hypothetical protein
MRINRQDAENAKEENTPRIDSYFKTQIRTGRKNKNRFFPLAYFPAWRSWRLGG